MKNWIIAYGAIWIIYFWLFGLQRTTLKISRINQIEWRGRGEALLPKWYPITWLITIGKWLLILAMAIFGDWRYALGLAIIGWVLSIIVPIPYSFYKKILQKRIDKENSTGLSLMLQAWLDKSGTKRPNDEELSKEFVRLIFHAGSMICKEIANGIEMTLQGETKFPVNDDTNLQVSLAILGNALAVLNDGSSPLMTAERGAQIALACKLSIKNDYGLGIDEAKELNQIVLEYQKIFQQAISTKINPLGEISKMMLARCLGKGVLALTYPGVETFDIDTLDMVCDLLMRSTGTVLKFWIGK